MVSSNSAVTTMLCAINASCKASPLEVWELFGVLVVGQSVSFCGYWIKVKNELFSQGSSVRDYFREWFQLEDIILLHSSTAKPCSDLAIQASPNKCEEFARPLNDKIVNIEYKFTLNSCVEQLEQYRHC